MSRIKRALSVVSVLLLATSVVTAGRPGTSADLPRWHSPGALDGKPVTLHDPAGTAVWAVWSYSAGREFAIAISAREATGLWSRPEFIGLGDRLDQVEPAMVRDSAGSIYLAYVVRQTGTLEMTALYPGRDGWFAPQQVSPPGVRAAAPALSIVGDRLVLGYRTGSGQVRLQDYALLPAPSGEFNPDGVQEGPDGFPLPTKQAPADPDLPGEEDEGSEPTPSSTFGKGGGSSPGDESH